MFDIIRQIIYKHNPLNFHPSKFDKYNSIIKDIATYISSEHISEDFIKDKFIDNFGDSHIIYQLKKNPNIYNFIYHDIINESHRTKTN